MTEWHTQTQSFPRPGDGPAHYPSVHQQEPAGWGQGAHRLPGRREWPAKEQVLGWAPSV